MSNPAANKPFLRLRLFLLFQMCALNSLLRPKEMLDAVQLMDSRQTEKTRRESLERRFPGLRRKARGSDQDI